MPQGLLQEALPKFVKLVAGRRIVLGPQDPSTIRSMNGLAELMMEMRKFRAASMLWEQARPLPPPLPSGY